MSTNTALAISVGVLGAIATWLFLGPLGGALAIWAAFIAWGCFFHCGGKEQGLQSAILNNAAGAVIAGITLVVATKTGMADKLGLPIWAAICVGIGVAAMVLLANIPMFADSRAGLRLRLGGRLYADEGRRRKPDGGVDGESGRRRHPVDDHRRRVRLRVGEARRHAGGHGTRRTTPKPKPQAAYSVGRGAVEPRGSAS